MARIAIWIQKTSDVEGGNERRSLTHQVTQCRRAVVQPFVGIEDETPARVDGIERRFAGCRKIVDPFE
jgi:hypothetical protein